MKAWATIRSTSAKPRLAMGFLFASILSVSSPASAQGATGADDAIRAMQQGNCERAVDVANKGLADGDPKAYFVVGMMRLRGLCITAAPEKAGAYFEPAAKAGHVDSAYMRR